MLFNSVVFVLLFLPAVFLLFAYVHRRSIEASLLVLLIASIVFYAWWRPVYLLLLGASIGVNYAIGLRLQAAGASRGWLILGVALNLGCLAFFKYTDFFIGSLDDAFGFGIARPEIVLPLAISFYTFTQIAYLVDSWRGLVKDARFSDFALFVTFFPHLIAGPIVHHSELMPQFRKFMRREDLWQDLAFGLTWFSIGLFKKVVIADTIAAKIDPVYAAAKAGQLVTFLEAWAACLGYTVQLYFDFSGYSDMAVGLGLMFGVKLPLNFASPYKAVNIVEFWRRWHITLSRFLREYLYVPLGGNRKGPVRRYVNLMITMLLGGLWHGAGWTFVIWGTLHGVYLCLNHLWRGIKATLGWRQEGGYFARLGAGALTFMVVALAWVLFRADSLASAGNIFHGLVGGNGVLVSEKTGAWLAQHGALPAWIAVAPDKHVGALTTIDIFSWIAVALALVWLAPNTQQLMGEDGAHWYRWKPTFIWTSFATIASIVPLYYMLYLPNRIVRFIYYNF